MLNGTETIRYLLRAAASRACGQGAFAESPVRRVYLKPLSQRRFHSKYVKPRKGLKGSIKLDTSELVFFCRAIPLSLWVGSLLSVARGGALCQLGND